MPASALALRTNLPRSRTGTLSVSVPRPTLDREARLQKQRIAGIPKAQVAPDDVVHRHSVDPPAEAQR